MSFRFFIFFRIFGSELGWPTSVSRLLFFHHRNPARALKYTMRFRVENPMVFASFLIHFEWKKQWFLHRSPIVVRVRSRAKALLIVTWWGGRASMDIRWNNNVSNCFCNFALGSSFPQPGGFVINNE